VKFDAHWMLGLGVAGVAAVLVVFALVLPVPGPATSHGLRPGDAGIVARGERVYQAHCAACHGARLEGQPNWRERGADGRLPAPPHDARGHTWHHPDDMLFRLTKHGLAKVANLKNYHSAMPAYDGVLSDEEIIAVLSWIKAQWPAEVRERHDEINRQVLR
jgi:mono/diheme cytochrome c family protein